MADSDSSDVEFLEVREAAASASSAAAEPNAERGISAGGGAKPSKKRRKAPPGPPPRLAWGAGSAIGGVGGGVGGAGGTFSRRSSGDSYGSREDAPRKKKAAPPLDDDDDGLWDDDDDDLVIPTRDATMTSAVASKSSASASGKAKSKSKSKSSKGGGTTKRKAKKNSKSSSKSSGGGISDLMGAPAASAASSSSTTAEAAMMWVDKYTPQTSADLCVAPKKVKEIREWMLQASDKTTSSNSCDSDPFAAGIVGGGMGGFGMNNALPPTPGGEPVPQILILVGSSGVGKSTTIRVLASEMGWTVHQWNDAQQDTPSGGARYGPGSFDSAMSVRYLSQMSSFEEFLAAAGTGYSALDFGGDGDGSSGIGKSEPLPLKAGKKRKVSSSKVKAAAIDDDRAASSKSTGSIILIEDIPNLYNPEAEATFRSIMAQHIHKSQTPTVLIFSDVSEGKHRPADLERLIEPSILYSPLARICQIHGVAKPKMKKCLQVIVKKEQLRGTSDLLFEELHATSKGDMRHAIMALQFQYASAGGSKGVGRRSKIGKTEYNERERDTKLSMFRALGKLLYAKRKKLGANDEEYIRKISSWNSILPGRLYDSRPPLEFVPEDVMSTGDIDHKNAVSFLQYHCPEFFTDEMELSTAFDHFSDAALFLDREYSVSRDRSDSIFPLEYVSSIAGRAVANANKNPAPNRFRQLSTPKVNDVMRKKRGNNISMLQLCQRLSCGGGDVLSLGANIGSTTHFVVDSLPYMRNIVPDGESVPAIELHFALARAC